MHIHIYIYIKTELLLGNGFVPPANIDSVLCLHMASLDQKELMAFRQLHDTSSTYAVTFNRDKLDHYQTSTNHNKL